METVITNTKKEYFVCLLKDLHKIFNIIQSGWEENGGIIVKNEHYPFSFSDCVIPKGSSITIKKEIDSPWMIEFGKEKPINIMYWMEDENEEFINPLQYFEVVNTKMELRNDCNEIE